MPLAKIASKLDLHPTTVKSRYCNQLEQDGRQNWRISLESLTTEQRRKLAPHSPPPTGISFERP